MVYTHLLSFKPWMASLELIISFPCHGIIIIIILCKEMKIKLGNNEMNIKVYRPPRVATIIQAKQ